LKSEFLEILKLYPERCWKPNARRLLALLISLSFGLKLFSQTFSPVKDTAIVRNRIMSESQKIASIQCDFLQEKNVSILSEKAVSNGKFYFKREDKVRLEYTRPVKNLIVMNGSKLMMESAQKNSQMDMHHSKIFQQLNSIIIGSINGNLFKSRDFTVLFFENDSQLKIELTPVAKTLKQFLSTIKIVLEKKDFTASLIEMDEISGDNTILYFSNKKVNGEMPDGLFSVK